MDETYRLVSEQRYLLVDMNQIEDVLRPQRLLCKLGPGSMDTPEVS